MVCFYMDFVRNATYTDDLHFPIKKFNTTGRKVFTYTVNSLYNNPCYSESLCFYYISFSTSCLMLFCFMLF